jgi:CheY-like chemotaxis protein
MTKPVVLVLDDEAAILRTTTLILQREGYTVVAAASAAEALYRLKTEPADLILLDCILGHESVIQEARRHNPDVRVAIFTFDPTLNDSPLAEIVLYKPVSPRQLLTTIADMCIAKAA